MKLELRTYRLSKNNNAVIFFPAFPTSVDMYKNQIEFLEFAQVPYIALNYPGIGDSEKPQKIEMSIGELVEIIIKNIINLDFDKLIPIGTSMGGYVIFELFRKRPDLIAGIVFCHTRPEALDEEGKKKRLSDIEKINSDLDSYLSMFSKNLVSDYSIENRKDVLEFLNNIIRKTSKEGLSSLVYTIATRPDSRETLKNILQPCLVIAGRQDKVVPLEVMENMAKELENSTFIVMETSGHMSPLEEPERFNNILLAFLKDHLLI